MFDIGADELLLIAVIAIIAIGPKDLPLALRTVGNWIGKVRKVSGHFRIGVEAMIREAELAEMEKKWREQNEEIMAKYPHPQMTGETASGADPAPPAASAEAASAEAAAEKPKSAKTKKA